MIRAVALICALSCGAGVALGASELAFEHWGVREPVAADDPVARAAPIAIPATYPLIDDFHRRREDIIRALAQEDLARWRRGWFKGGDPGKYLPGAAMARLLVDPADDMARSYMNDERSYAEHYHFAAVNWARFLPQFRAALNDDTFERLKQAAGANVDYLSGGGTENHKTMWYTGPLVLPWYLEGGLGRRSKQETLDHGKRWLRDYVRTIYHHGMGEWESATYNGFTINGFLNIYDYSKDPEVRLLAKAGLDYFVGAYALKYTDGVLAGPTQRGYGRKSAGKLIDHLGWLWWGASKELRDRELSQMRYTSHAWTSRWRPNRVLTNIATKNLPDQLPVEYRNSKANYWFGLRIPAERNVTQESLYLSENFTLGSLWLGWDQHGQTTRWQLTVRGADGAGTLTGGHPVDGRWFDGLGKYDQTAQHEGTLVVLSSIPIDDPSPYAFLHIPEGATWPELVDGWWIMGLHGTWIAVRPLTDGSAIGRSERSDKDRTRGRHPHDILIFPGRQTGFILSVNERASYPTRQELLAALNATPPDISTSAEDLSVSFLTADGTPMDVAWNSDGPRAITAIDGVMVEFDDWPIFGGPQYHLADGVLEVRDGQNGYRVDFTGALPRYSELD